MNTRVKSNTKVNTPKQNTKAPKQNAKAPKQNAKHQNGKMKRKINRFVPADYSIKDFFEMMKSNDPKISEFGAKQITSIFYAKPLSGPQRMERATIARKSLGILEDVKLNERDFGVGMKKWARAAKSKSPVANEKFIVADKIKSSAKLPGAKIMPMSGSEPAFVKWLWSWEKGAKRGIRSFKGSIVS